MSFESKLLKALDLMELESASPPAMNHMIRVKAEVPEEDDKQSENDDQDSVFYCELCGKVYNTVAELSLHNRVGHGRVVSVCKVCGASFRNSVLLFVHCKHAHGLLQDLRCICNTTFTSVRALKSHQDDCRLFKLVAKPQQVTKVCMVCGLQGLNAKRYKQHMMTHNTVEKSYTCTICNDSFSRSSTLHNHMKSVHTTKRLSCPFCSKQVKSKHAILYHVYKHREVAMPEDPTTLKQKNTKDETMETPMGSHDTMQTTNGVNDLDTANTRQEPVENGTVSKNEDNMALFKDVVGALELINKLENPVEKKDVDDEVDETEAENDHVTERCNDRGCVANIDCEAGNSSRPGEHTIDAVKDMAKGVTTRSRRNQACSSKTNPCDLKNDSENGHDGVKNVRTKKRVYRCPLCEKTTLCASSMKKHVLVEHNVKKRKHSNECGDINAYGPPEKRQLKAFVPSQQSKCEICGRVCADRAALQDHLAIHTGEVTVSCHLCEKSFITKHAHRVHLRMTHDIVSKRQRGKNPTSQIVKCHLCGLDISKSAFSKHIDIHNGVYRFTCNYCNKMCRSKHDLRVHKRTHTGEKPYKCDICERRFSDQANLTHHMRNVHKKAEKKVQKLRKTYFHKPLSEAELDQMKKWCQKNGVKIRELDTLETDEVVPEENTLNILKPESIVMEQNIIEPDLSVIHTKTNKPRLVHNRTKPINTDIFSKLEIAEKNDDVKKPKKLTVVLVHEENNGNETEEQMQENTIEISIMPPEGESIMSSDNACIMASNGASIMSSSGTGISDGIKSGEEIPYDSADIVDALINQLPLPQTSKIIGQELFLTNDL